MIVRSLLSSLLIIEPMSVLASAADNRDRFETRTLPMASSSCRIGC